MIFSKLSFPPQLILALLLPSTAITASLPDHHLKRSTDIGVVLSSAAQILTVFVPTDGILYKISDLVSSPPLSANTIGRLNYDSILLLNDDRCLFQGESSVLVLGGGLPTSQVVCPPQLIVNITCGSLTEAE